MQVTVEFMFPAAHHLPHYDGPCRNPHGHNYRLQVTVEGKPDAWSGMIIDFVELKRLVHETVLAKVDHSDLNALMENPTAERIAVWIWERLAPALKGLREVRLYEQDDCYVTYSGEGA
jgi:6-pyruvoyltetrahydropterin/6-carboxytetrahydropterin synthase